MRVGFLGLGNLGGPMCRRLVDHGHQVAAHDPSPAAVARWAGGGARVAAGPADAAAGAEVVCVVVRDDAQARAAVAGEGGVLAALAPGAVVVLHATVAPSTVDELAAACRAAGAGFVDAGLSGGPDRALAGTLVAVCGGDGADLAVAEPVIAAYAADVLRCGPVGAGMAAKLARNLAQYGVWCALFEGMDLAAGAGVDLATFARYVHLSGLAANNDVVLGRDGVEPLSPGPGVDDDRLAHLRWAVALGWKDLDDAFELAERLGRDVPVGRVARHRYALALGLALPGEPA